MATSHTLTSRLLSCCTPLVLASLAAGCVLVDDDDGGGSAPIRDVAIVGTGLEFGECDGYCKTEVAIDGADLEATLSSLRGDLPQLVNRGRLTDEARDELNDLAEDLAGRELEPRYGCPDCSDGGAVSFDLRDGDDVTEHAFDHSQPPQEFEQLNAALSDIALALLTCEPSPRVELTSCTPR